jgi:hypothetical protein
MRRALKCFIVLGFGVGSASGAPPIVTPQERLEQPPQAQPAVQTRIVVLGVSHSKQLVSPSYQPALFRAFFDRVGPAAICIERSPNEYARGSFYEFTYEQQDLAEPYAREHGISLYPIDWLPAQEDTLLAFGLADLEEPPFVRNPTGFRGFLSFDQTSDLATGLFYADSEADRKQRREFADTPAHQAQFDFARRLFLYRTFMQAMRIQRVARAQPGKTVLVLIGDQHKDEIERILSTEPSFEIVQPSAFGLPDPAAVEMQMKLADTFAIASFNLLGVQSKTQKINWAWLGALMKKLEDRPQTAEILLLRTRLRVLTRQLGPTDALRAYEVAYELAAPAEQFTWTGVRDRSRLDSFCDPFGNLSVRQRAQVEMAREANKNGQAAATAEIKEALAGSLTPFKAAQLHAYWDEYVLHMS